MLQTSAPALTSDQRDEIVRLAALERHDILDTAPEPAFDRITRLVRAIFDVPMSTITLIDGHRQWFKSRDGVADAQTSRQPALCYVAIKSAATLVVPDTLRDVRFQANPLVIDGPKIRFYAGALLQMGDGAIIGTLCAMGTTPRAFDARDVAILNDLAAIVAEEISRRPPPVIVDASPVAPVVAAPETPTLRRVLKAGRITFNAGRSSVDCTIRGLSDAGAAIDLISTAGVPDEFKLAIPADEFSRACRITSRREGHLEVAFK